MTVDGAQDRRLADAGDDYDRHQEDLHQAARLTTVDLDPLAQAAQKHDIYVRGIADRDDGSAAILFVYDIEQFAHYFTTGYFPSVEEAAEFSQSVFESHSTEELMANILKNNKLFPNIRGVMLKEKRVTLHLSGKHKIVEMRDGGDARCEIFFTDHAKTAVINRTQLLDIVDVHGEETDEWAGKPVVLYGEEGNWFGKHQWGVRVDLEATRRAAREHERQQAQAQPKQKSNGQKPDDDANEPVGLVEFAESYAAEHEFWEVTEIMAALAEEFGDNIGTTFGQRDVVDYEMALADRTPATDEQAA